MEYRPLHITVKSAEGLKDVKLFGKMDVYAAVSIAGYPQSVKRTRVDKDGGSSPKWKKEGPMEFMVDEPYLTKPGLSLLFQLKAESSFGSDKDVGSATVPIHDLFKPDSDPTQEKTVEFQIHTPSGKPKGSLKFSYRFGEKFTHQVPDVPDPVMAMPYAAGGSAYPPPAAGYGVYPPQAVGYGYGYNQGPPPQGYGYAPPPPHGYGYAPPPQGYGYPPPPGAYGQPQNPKKNKAGMGAGLGLGLGAGLLGGLLVGEIASDVGDAAAYADGYGDAMDDVGGGFDF